MHILTDRVCLITGAAEGIGAAIAERFARAGATLLLLDIQEEANARRAEDLARLHGVPVLALRADVSDSASLRAAVDAGLARFGRIDILVNNAAIALSGQPWEMPDDDWDRVIRTNLTSAFLLVRAVLPGMRERRDGVILNIASTQAHRSWPGWTAYAAAKGGLLAMTTQLAGQLGPDNIRVNAISPGAIDTPMNRRRAAEEGNQITAEWARMHALGRCGTPDEVAAAALFLCSPEAAFITGHDLRVDGGLCCLPRE